MKQLVLFLSLSALYIFYACSSTASATSSAVTTTSFKVSGVCGMCKKRIETAAYGIKGVQSATWTAKDQKLSLSYDASKTNVELVKKRIAAAGHDTEGIKADALSYSKLPACCKFKDGVEVHED